jgi:hypothetical protein
MMMTNYKSVTLIANTSLEGKAITSHALLPTPDAIAANLGLAGGRALESPSLVLVINDTKLLMPCV